MSALADRVPVPVLVVDRDGVVVRRNDAAREYLGDAVAVDSALTSVVSDVDGDVFESLLTVGDGDDDRDGGGERGRERRVRFDIDGRPRRPPVRATPIADGVELVVDTVAERNEYGELVENVGDPMYVLDELGYLTMVNDALVEAYGYDRAELVGAHATKFMPEDAFERGTEEIVEVLDGERETAPLEFRTEHADGTEAWAEVNLDVLTDGDGDYSGSVGVIRDVTERKRRARELADFEAIAETAPVGMFTVDEDGVVTWANWRLYERLGMSQDELVDRPFYELVDEGFVEPEMVDRYVEFVKQLLSDDSDRERADHEEVLHPPDEETMHVEAHTALLPRGDDGEFSGTVNAFRDITQRKTYREELERQNDRLEAFASVVSHDLRNPLNVASGHLELARNRHPDDESLAEVGTSLSRMSELIDDILSLARQGETVSEPEAVDLETTAHKAWGTVDTRDAELSVRTDAIILGVDSRIQQLLENLFRNAVEHGSTSNRTESGESVEHGSTGNQTPAGGDHGPDSDAGTTVHGNGGLEPTLTVSVRSVDDGFVVADDGPGLPPDVDIFELGATTEDNGTGLGLAIVAEIVEAHGWEIAARETDSGGACFEVTDVDFVGKDARTDADDE